MFLESQNYNHYKKYCFSAVPLYTHICTQFYIILQQKAAIVLIGHYAMENGVTRAYGAHDLATNIAPSKTATFKLNVNL